MNYRKVKTLLVFSLAALLALASACAFAEDRPIQLKLGGRAAYVGTDSASDDGVVEATLNVYAVAAPTVRIEFPCSERWSLEAGARYEFFMAELENSTSDGASDLTAISFDFGPIYRFDAFKNNTITPFLKAAAVVTIPESDMHAPTEKYKTGLGAEGSLGLAADRWEIRLGYEWMELRPVDDGFNDTTQEVLNLPQYFLEAVYKFNL